MKVKDKDNFKIDKFHSIQWGKSSWENGKDKSIRNKYLNANMKFNRVGSGEISWKDFNIMVLESIKRNEFSEEEKKELLFELLKSIK